MHRTNELVNDTGGQSIHDPSDGGNTPSFATYPVRMQSSSTDRNKPSKAPDRMVEPLQLASRNDSLGFAERTRKNLDFIVAAAAQNKDIHLVTQIVNSMLGLVVFPWEATFSARTRQIRIADLKQEGWPEWRITLGSSETLGDLIENLRHATAHRGIRFSSESPLPQEVEVTVWNRPRKKAAINWIATIRADELQDFCMRFMRVVQSTLD